MVSLPANDLPQYKKTDKLLAKVRQKSKPKFLQGFISPVHFFVMENTSNLRCQLIHK